MILKSTYKLKIHIISIFVNGQIKTNDKTGEML